MPASRAIASAAASGLSENTPTIRAGTRPASIARINARRFEPRPEASTAIRNIAARSTDADALVAGGRDDGADRPRREAEAIAVGGHRGDVAGSDDQHEADAAVERAPHLLARHRAFALQPVEHRRQHDRRRV